MKLKVFVEPGEDSGFIASVPALPGCHTQGATREELMENVREAIDLWLAVEQDKVDRSDAPADVMLVEV